MNQKQRNNSASQKAQGHLQRYRRECRDVWNAFLVEQARYTGAIEMPILKPCDAIPNRLIAFSDAINSRDSNYWVHFYEDDYKFERLWRNPRRYLDILKRYNGVILPDFSVYRDMPLVMQLWNIYRSRALGTWLQSNGLNVIPNLRWGDERTHMPCCLGIPFHSTISIGTHGAVREPMNRAHLEIGLSAIVDKLKPSALVVYGTAPASIFERYRDEGIHVVTFSPKCKLIQRASN